MSWQQKYEFRFIFGTTFTCSCHSDLVDSALRLAVFARASTQPALSQSFQEREEGGGLRPCQIWLEVASLTKAAETLRRQDGISIHASSTPRRSAGGRLSEHKMYSRVQLSHFFCILLDEGRQDTCRPKWEQSQAVIFSCSKLSWKGLWCGLCDIPSTVPAYAPSFRHCYSTRNPFIPSQSAC